VEVEPAPDTEELLRATAPVVQSLMAPVAAFARRRGHAARDAPAAPATA
jgi:hypothetical protein